VPPSDIAEAVSKVMSEQPFSSTKDMTAQLRASRKLVKRTLIEVLGVKKFNLRWVPHELAAARKAQRVVDSPKLFRVLRVDAANGSVNMITEAEKWYYRSYDYSLQCNTSRNLVPNRPPKKSDSTKSLFTVMFSGYGLLALDD
jgi:hypothetical protein